MLRSIVFIVAAWSLHSFASAGQAPPPPVFESNFITLYQPGDVVEARVPGGVEPLATYIEALEKAGLEFWRERSQSSGRRVLVAVIVKPGRAARVWVTAIPTALPPKDVAAFRSALEKVQAVDVTAPLAFAFEANLWGGDGTKSLTPKVPPEWADAARLSKGPTVIPEGLLPILWP